MSSYYGLSSQFGCYDIKLSKCVSSSIYYSPLPLSIAPPSYSQVILEKLQTQQQAAVIITTWERKLKEFQSLVEDAKKEIYQVQEVMQYIQYRCIRLECKNEYLLEHLKQTSELAFSLSSSTHDANNEIVETEDSLNRMNVSVETLIEEAQKSLTSHFSLKADPVRLRRTRSYPCFTEINYPENRRKSSYQDHQTNINNDSGDTAIDLKNKYQKTRYFHSQWKLMITMKQLLESVQHTIETKQGAKVMQQQQKKVKLATTIPPLPLVEINNQEKSTTNLKESTPHVHIHHHHHHHIHHHLPSDIDTPSSSPSKHSSLQITNDDDSKNSFLNKIKSQTSITAKNATTSLLQYVGIISSEDKIISSLQTTLASNSNNCNTPVKYRTMFLATMAIMQMFDNSPNHFPRQRLKWASRGNRILKRWYQNPILKILFPIWLRKAHVVFYVARCFKIK